MKYLLRIIPFILVVNTFSQTCQTIDVQLDSFVPARNTNGIIRVCVNQMITLNGSATFSDNDIGATYEWDLGDGNTIAGTTASFSYTAPGVYIANLKVSGTTPSRCNTSTNINQVIQVSTEPDFTGTGASESVLCFGESTTIDGVVNPEEFVFNCTPPVGTTTALPDGVGVPYETSVFVDCYDPSQTLTNTDQIVSICLSLEHSYLGDLDIDIISPNGQTVRLFQNNPGITANLGTPWATGVVDALSTNTTPGVGSLYCFMPNNTLPTLDGGVLNGGVFVSGNGPGTYIDSYVPAGNYRSTTPLSGLVGSPLNGEWKIRIVDNEVNDNGNIFEWQITFDPSILPANFTFTPSIVSQSWDADASIINTNGNTITVQPTTAGTHCYTYRVVDDFGCEYTEEVCVEMIRDIQVESLPLDIFLCDTGSDNIEVFDFSNNEGLVVGSQPTSEVEVSYHPSEQDAIDNTARLSVPYTNTLPVETIWMRIADITQTCFKTAQFDIRVLPIPVANKPVDFELCDDNTDGNDANGIGVTFDLLTKINEVLGGQSIADFEVKFYNTQAEADAAVLGTEFTTVVNTVTPQQVFARMENRLNTDCYTSTSFNLIVNPLPVTQASVTLTQCDDDTDGQAAFNLTEANVLISGNSASETFTYYVTETQAIGGLMADQIPNPTTYVNLIPVSGSVVYARIETSEGCYRTAQIDLEVGVSQIPASFTTLEYYVCDTKDVDNDNTNGIATFNFSDARQTIRNLFPLPNITVTFYNNESDALAEINAIDINNHRNDTSPFTQNIYVRIDSDNVNACLGLGHHVTLTVEPLPTNNTINDYVLCSDTNSATFNLNTKTAEVIGTETRPMLVTYHESEQDAINNIPIPDISNYNSTDKIIYVRAQFDDNTNGILDSRECVSTDMSFELKVIPNPVVFIPDPIKICNDQVNTLYDLTIREDQITGGDTSIALSYFESQANLDNNTPIINPETYNNLNIDSNILVLARGTNNCTSIVNLELKTIIYDVLNLNPTALEECEIDNNGIDNFDLRRSEVDILNGLAEADFDFTYYENQNDAEAGNTNFIQDPSTFENKIINGQTLYVRVIPKTNECFQIAELQIIVNQVPEIQIEKEYVICLAPDGGVITAVGNVLIESVPIDTQLSPIDYSFQWYRGNDVNPSNIIPGETGETFSPTEAGNYTVIATNLISGCTIPATTTVIGSYPPERITAEVTTDAFSNNDIIEVMVEGNGEYEYRLDDGSWQSSSTFENVRGGEHIVSVRDIYNCDELVSETIIIIDYPKFFTPNNDGTNDTWQIYGITNQRDAKIYIYDRYGKLLKQLNPTGIGWNGTFNGVRLPTGDYWFTVEYTDPNKSNVKKLFRAHFTLKR